MSVNRRDVLKAGSGAAVYSALASMGFFVANPAMASAWDEKSFGAKSVADALAAMGVSAPADAAGKVTITAPDIAENGAVVPVDVESSLPGTQMVAVLVDKNPQPLAGTYAFMAGAEPSVSMRVKMGQSSDVVVLVKADGKFYTSKKEVKVTLGGCGG